MKIALLLLTALAAAGAAHAASLGPLEGVPTTRGATTFAGAAQWMAQPGIIAKVIADLQSADSVAGAVNPNSTDAAPYNVWNPYAHQCAPVAISWLKEWPTAASVPKATGSGGVITSVVVSGANLQATQDFIGNLAATGIPPAVHTACDPFVMWVIRQPAALRANASADFVNFLTLFMKR